MCLRMNKVRSWLLILAGIAFVLDPVLIGFVNATEVTLPSGEVLELSDTQLENIKSQPGVFYSPEHPETLAGQTVVELPSELGGGFLYGTPAALAQAITQAGAAVGATEETVRGPAITAKVVGVVAGIAAAVGLAAAALAGGGGGDGGGRTTTNH